MRTWAADGLYLVLMQHGQGSARENAKNGKAPSPPHFRPARSYCMLMLYAETRGGQMASGTIAAALTVIALVVARAAGQRRTDGPPTALHGTRWRLWEIDAPETRQACADGWPAGLKATAAMRKLIGGRAVTCEFRGHDRYKRSIGLCRANGQDLRGD